jgi:beta-N-acetylhexosaminidase
MKDSIGLFLKRTLVMCMSILLAGVLMPATSFAAELAEEPPAPDAVAPDAASSKMPDLAAGSEEGDIDAILSKMTLDEKVSQLIIPAIRTWNENNVVDLAAVPDLAAALRRHQFGGIILFASNVVDAEQTHALTAALQANNAAGPFTTKIPYLMPVDEEGGAVVRFGMGTRMTGSMAIGATGANAQANARATGEVLGEEISALGFNADFAPSIDVNANPANPVIGTRSFSDDPATVASLGLAYGAGLAEKGVVSTFKHFPGHGDTGTDTHLEMATVNKTYEELKAVELAPFQQAIDKGADLIMTAHVTLPKYDDQVEFFNGTVGNLPATMSHKILTDLLRGEMGYKGVIVTDALEMNAIDEAGLVAGEVGSVEYASNIADACLNAGDDMLLLPRDLNSPSNADFYDAYVAALVAKVQKGEIPEARVNESVRRVLALKEKYGILNPKASAYGLEVVGSAAHHDIEMDIASQAITLVKNQDHTLPASGHEKKIVLLGRDKADNVLLCEVVRRLQAENLVDKDAYVNNLAAGSTAGSADAKAKVTIDYYYDFSDTDNEHYTDELKAAIGEASTVVCLTKNWGVSALQNGSPQYKGVARAIADTHAAGGKFVLVSGNLPYDVARYPEADAVLCAYMCSGMDTDPTTRSEKTGNVGAYNANAICAFQTVFDASQPQGTLPVRIPTVTMDEKGTIGFDLSQTLYQRGYGLPYEYVYTEVAKASNGVFKAGATGDLLFVTNARADKLKSVLVDGEELGEGQYSVAQGSTRETIKADYLNTLENGKHTLTSRYDYGAGEFDVKTEFTVQGKVTPSTPSASSSTSTTASTAKTSSTSTTQANRTTSSLARTGDSSHAALPWLLAGLVVLLVAMAKGARPLLPF